MSYLKVYAVWFVFCIFSMVIVSNEMNFVGQKVNKLATKNIGDSQIKLISARIKPICRTQFVIGGKKG